MELIIYNTKGKKTNKKCNVDDAVFGIEPNDHAIYLDVKHYLAAQRQGTHKSKERAEITGSTKKIRKQKGTGGARFGDIKSPLLRGGGRVFGPQPRDYSFKLNKKVKKLARFSALSYKVKQDAIKVIEDLNIEQPKTKEMLELLKNFDANEKKTLIVLKESNKNVYLSARNLKTVKTITASQLNTYDLMNASSLLILESAISEIK
jgi:large subunit ribosomal protein L4